MARSTRVVHFVPERSGLDQFGDTITADEFKALGKKRSRHPAKKPVIDGHRFDSGREAERYRDLKLAVAAGVIRDLEVHPRIPIIIGGVPVKSFAGHYRKNGRQLYYEADFRYFDLENGVEVLEDVKMQSGYRTETYRLKKAMVQAMGLEITEL